MKTNYVLESSEFELEEKAKGVARLIILMNSCLPYISQEEKSPHEKKKFTDRVRVNYTEISVINSRIIMFRFWNGLILFL